MAVEPISQKPIDSPDEPLLQAKTIYIALAILAVGALIYLIYRILKSRGRQPGQFELDYKAAKDLCTQNADPRLYSSFWRFGSNRPIYRVFMEDGERQIMHLTGSPTYYMGHFPSKSGILFLAFCSRRSWGIFPVMDVLMLPMNSARFLMETRLVTVDCVSVDRLDDRLFYMAVTKTKDGETTRDDFGGIEQLWKERMAAHVIVEQGDAALQLANTITHLNPDIQLAKKSKSGVVE